MHFLSIVKCSVFSIAFLMLSFESMSQNKRARDLGIPLDGTPGFHNAITDVKGVEVGHSTIIKGEGKLKVGEGPIRTGVTAILPRGKTNDSVFGGWYSLNGNGEMTGTTWLEESGFLEGPVMITNTHSVGVVHDAVIEWQYQRKLFNPLPGTDDVYWSLPVVAETWDGDLNDINGFHVKKEHAFEALSTAVSGPVIEGNVGGGTGMICHEFKGGIGTSSRVITIEGHRYTLGVLVQANYGIRRALTIAGVPVGKEISDLMPLDNPLKRNEERGSIIVVVATDAPLMPHQLKRIARRVPLGISRMGGYASNGSGDIFIAFSTANPKAGDRLVPQNIQTLPNDKISSLFEATAQATEEAIINAMLAAETMVGKNGTTVYELPEKELIEILKKYNRLD